MARVFATASSTYILAGAGNMASQAYTYGTVAALVKRNTTTVAYHCLLCNTDGVSTVGFSLEFDTAGSIYTTFNNGVAGAVSNLNTFTSTTTWYTVIVSKATGTVKPRIHVYDSAAGTWTHADTDTALADGTDATRTIMSIGSYGNTGDFADTDIEAVGCYRTWVPTDLEAEGAGLHLSRMAWIETSARADKAWVSFLDQDATSTPICDLLGGGTQSSTSTTVPAISANAVPLFGWGGSSMVPSAVTVAAANSYPPNRYLFKPAVQRAATW